MVLLYGDWRYNVKCGKILKMSSYGKFTRTVVVFLKIMLARASYMSDGEIKKKMDIYYITYFHR